MPNKVKQITADTAYDSNHVYHSLDNHFSCVDIVIPPRNNATDENHHHWMRNRNLREIKIYGRMKWQSNHDYRKRNQAERAIGKYKEFSVIDRTHVNYTSASRSNYLRSILKKMIFLSLSEIPSKF